MYVGKIPKDFLDENYIWGLERDIWSPKFHD